MTTALRVPHGCQSAAGSPTRGITITIPQGINRLQVGYVHGWVRFLKDIFVIKYINALF